MTFSERLRQTIEKTGVSRDEFAALTGVSRSQIFNYLKGESEPSLAFFQRLKESFPWADIQWLATGEQRLTVAEPQPKYGRDEIKKKICQLLDAMDEEKRRDVLKYVAEKKQLMDCLEQLRGKKTG